MSIAKTIATFLLAYCIVAPVAQAAPMQELSVDEAVEIGIGHNQHTVDCGINLLDVYSGGGEAELVVMQYDTKTETWIPDTHTTVRGRDDWGERTHRILLNGNGGPINPAIATARISGPKRSVVVILVSAAGKTYGRPVGPVAEIKECQRV